ncbi:MAG: cation diffusion facilitator family transporter [Firmicutes bacterium]|nr:cation diffusion facilitator family transporter [Bacillota bacterium]
MVNGKYKSISKVLWIILVLNIIVAAAKIAMGTYINSESMTADGFHSLTDGSSNVIGIIGIAAAAKPVDEDHPYGHKKYETLTGLFIVGMLGFLGFKIISEAITKFANPITPEISIQSFIVMLVTLCINIFVTRYEHRKGVELNSTILVSDAMHTKSDIYVTIGVIVTLVAIKLGAPPVVDTIASVVVAGFIFHAAYEIFKSASGILVDCQAVEAERIERIALAQDGVKGVHKIRSRGTADDIYIDMHVQADAHMSLQESHRLMHEIENSIRGELNCDAQVIIHIEPSQDETEKF